MSWKTRMTTCLVAALLGVFIGAAYAAVTGRFDAPAALSPSALPVPIEQGALPAPVGRFAPAAPSRAASTDERDPSPPGRAKEQKASKAKPPKLKHKASGSSEKSSPKHAGKANKRK